ncbi:MAG: xanthine dehydrogenase FAD-binding subunit XdhB [Clostridia bacterium]|nr:xanthine dehydrogenase FAD-binding subunit XdhB [Clostridia bacterium]
MYDIDAIYEAKSVSDAVRLRQEHPRAVIIAGGSDVLIKIREGKLAGAELISIYKLDELRGVSMDEDGTLRILPLTSFSHITANALLREHIPVLCEAADVVGGPQVRNIGTIGGNISNGVTSADTASTLHAWDAEVELTGANGVRRLTMREYQVGAGRVDLHPDELLTAILIRRERYEGYFGRYIKYSMRAAMDIATLGCSANVRLSPDRCRIEDMRLAFGVAAPTAIRAHSAEAAARGAAVCGATVDACAAAALQDVSPRTSWRASKEFRLQLTRELTRRALKDAIIRAGGEL